MADRTSRPPLALVGVLLLFAVAAVRSLTLSWTVAPTTEANLSSRTWLALGCRLLSCAIVWHRGYVVIMRSPPVFIDVRYGKGSAFEPRRIELGGRGRLCTFTVQSWFLEGIYFAVATAASLGFPVARLGRVLFGVVFATSHLVSSITAYILLPTAARSAARERTNVYDSPLLSTNGTVCCCEGATVTRRAGLVMHNANVALVHLELLVSGQSIALGDMGAAVLWALWYIVFAWRMASQNRWLPYPFIDYTLPVYVALPVHLALAALLAAFHLLGVAFSVVLAQWSLVLRLAVHATLVRLVTRLKPPDVPASPS